MAKTLFLALTTTPQAITVETNCSRVTVKEDEAVSGWPTATLQLSKPSASDDVQTLTAGKSYTFERPKEFPCFRPGEIIGYLSIANGTTTGMQDEE